MRKIFLNLFIVLSFLLIGCNFEPNQSPTPPEPQPINPENILVSENSLTMTVGESKQVIITIEPENSEYELVWSVNNDCVTVVDGLITAVKAGDAVVTVTCKDTDLFETINVNIKNPTYTITYELNGGSVSADLPNSYIQEEGIISLPTAEKEGFIFEGWFINDVKTESIDKSVGGDLVIIAKWSEIPIDYDQEIAEIIDLIYALPSIINYSDYNRVNEIQIRYDKLPNEHQERIENYGILKTKIDELTAIESDINTITYVLGEDIFTSKIELFNNFFGDFYQFIINRGGYDYLESKGVSDLASFLDIASDYDAGRGSMRHIGDVAGSYMLSKDVNGILENQPTTTFFGYCYQHGLYEDLLPFFIRFFAYWRIDERYANTSNYGADTFAESWAPTVDIAKFFYYDENTSYVQTERMLDCFLNISNVLYGDLPTELTDNVILPTNLILRGYKFEGWYDNPEFTGDPITNVTNDGKKIILYAKWSEDTEQKDLEAAEMVKIYIYNLTTEPANVTKTTVGYVRTMYDQLSENAKQLVDNYDVFLPIEEEVMYLLEEPIVVTIKFDIERNFEDLKNEFLIDFNTITQMNVKSFDEFINNRYGLMSKVGLFFKDKGMFIKWAFIIEGFLDCNPARGLRIQSNRILDNEGGDLEYVSKALGYFFKEQNASDDGETSINFADSNIINSILNQQDEISVTFTIAQKLPEISIAGHTFDGYYYSNDKIENVEVGMPTTLVIKFK